MNLALSEIFKTGFLVLWSMRKSLLQMPMHADVSNRARGLNFGLSLPLLLYSKTCVNGHSKIDKTKIFKINASSMRLKVMQNAPLRCSTCI